MANSQIRGGQIGPLDLTTEVTGTLPVGNGGTGATSLAAAGIPSQSVVDVNNTALLPTGNLIIGSDFEVDALWVSAFGAQSTDTAYSGTKSRKITATGAGTGSAGDRLVLTHDLVGAPLRFAIGTTRRFDANVKLRKHASNTGTASPALHFTLVGYSAAGTETVIQDVTITEAALSSSAWTELYVGGYSDVATAVTVALYVAIDSTVPSTNRYYVDSPTMLDTTALGAWAIDINNKIIKNPTITNYVESVVAIGNTSTAKTIDLTNGTFQTATLTGNCTFTMPALVAGKSFVLQLKTGAGGFTATFTSVKWPGSTAPVITTTASRMDKLFFDCDGAAWYGTFAQNYTP